jgi:hypothetical protein
MGEYSSTEFFKHHPGFAPRDSRNHKKTIKMTNILPTCTGLQIDFDQEGGTFTGPVTIDI